MNKIISYIIFAAVTVIIVIVFLTSKSYMQLAVGTLLYPPLAYFALVLFPRKIRINDVQQSVAVQTSSPTPTKENVEIVDIDKRTFLKLVGTAGISFFIFSILSRRVESLLFGRAFNTGVGELPGQYVQEPSTTNTQPTEGYNIAEIDDLGATTYFGFTNKNGSWMIMKGDADGTSYRYAKGDKNFPLNWNNRENLSYDYYYNLF